MRRDSRIGRVSGLVVVAAMLFSVVGCTEEDNGNPSHWPPVGDVPEPFDYRTVVEPYAEGDVAACKAYKPFSEATTAMADLAQTRRECLCDACIDLMRDCDALEGCTEIRMCGIEKNCNSADSCYLLPPPLGGRCIAVIDKWGNSSVSTGLTQHLQNDCGCN